MIPFFVEESASPLVEELSSDLLVDIVSDKVLIFVIFMHEIHGISVPSPQRVPGSLSLIVVHDFNEFHYSFFKVGHLISTTLDFLEGILGTSVQSLTHHLEEQFGCQ